MSLKILNEGFNKYFKSLNEEKIDYVDTYRGCTIYKSGSKFISDYMGKSLSSDTLEGIKGKIEKAQSEHDKKYKNLPESKTKKNKKLSKSLRESKNYRGNEYIEFVSHGEWSDPELIYDGVSFNYWDVEDALWYEFLEETGYKDSDSGNPKVEAEFNKYVQKYATDLLDGWLSSEYNESLDKACSKEKCKKEDKKCKEKCTDESCDKKDVKKKNLKESEASQDISEYQKWVDFDMKKYKRISDETMRKIRKAGFSVVKDQYGDYEVIADRPIKESKKKTLDDIDAIADDRKERAKKAFARAKDDADSRRDYMKRHDMKESCKRKKIRKLKESLTNSPYKALIGEQFDHTFDFDFLDVVADLLDRIDFDAENIDEEVYSVIDEGLIYYADQWKVIQFYQTPEQANFNEAIEDLTGDLIELCNKIIESKE